MVPWTPAAAVKSGVRPADRGCVSPAFTFRLDPVLDLRRRREEVLQGEYAQAIRALAAQQERAVAAEEALAEATGTLRAASAGPVQLLELRALNDEIVRLRRILAHEREMVSRMEDVAEERRQELVQAARDREALDTLRRRAESAHRAEENRREQGVLDELATRRASRRDPSPAVA